jgi:dTDP-4-dehydrorhamnose 3,5-epimerase
MKIDEIKRLQIDSIYIMRFARFTDHRGYFTEQFRKSQFNEEAKFLKDINFVQANESYSKSGVIRGLHFQWNPYMGKLVRTIHGRMVDLFLDIRKGSPTFGKAAAYEMASNPDNNYSEWIWIPPGFAHGNYFSEDTTIEYFCSGEYSQGCEAGISPLAKDIDWSLCKPELKDEFFSIASKTKLITEKDVNGFTLEQWLKDDRSNNFLYESLS